MSRLKCNALKPHLKNGSEDSAVKNSIYNFFILRIIYITGTFCKDGDWKQFHSFYKSHEAAWKLWKQLSQSCFFVAFLKYDGNH